MRHADPGPARSIQAQEAPASTSKGASRRPPPYGIGFLDQHVDESPAGIRRAAAVGLREPTSSLPFVERLEQACGEHDLSGVRAHVGPAATRSAAAMNASAYASGEHIVFAGRPSLFSAAHEVAHVIQQRAGVSLSGGVGAAGDAHERHADEVAARVVAGRSAADLLPAVDGSSAAESSAVQRRVGFEMEYSIPLIQEKYTHYSVLPWNYRWTGYACDVARFLTGSPPYGKTGYKVPSSEIAIHADHEHTLTSTHKQLYDAAVVQGLVGPQPLGAHALAIPEYVTPAYDELLPGSTEYMHDQLDIAGDAMGQAYATATTPTLGQLSVSGLSTGVPVQAFRKFLTDLGKPPNALDAELAGVQNAIKDQVGPQATVGIIPSAIYAAHTSPAHLGLMFDANEQKPSRIAARQALGAAVDLTDAVYARLPGHLLTDEIRGACMLIASYLVGDAFGRSAVFAAHVKNAVPLLAKRFVLQDASPEVAQLTSADVTTITNAFQQEAGRYSDATVWQRLNTNVGYVHHADGRITPKDALVDDRSTFVRNALTREPLEIPWRNVNNVTDPISAQTTGQRGVILEYRRIVDRPDHTALWATFHPIVDQVRALNLHALTAVQRGSLVQQADANVTYRDPLWLTTRLANAAAAVVDVGLGHLSRDEIEFHL